jgi:chorismate dehydratase
MQAVDHRLRVAAINFLNPAPLMWDFEHEPRSSELAKRYEVHLTKPALCADELLDGRADLGLIPIASLAESLAIVPGCAIASLKRVRSIQLIVKLRGHAEDLDEVLRAIRSVAADTASRSSVAYAQIIFRRFLGTDPEFIPHPADAPAMLAQADAALLIGDPALLAVESRKEIERVCGPCVWLDLAEQWVARTQLPWVAAVWAVRPEALGAANVLPQTLVEDLQRSRDAGLSNVQRLVDEWTGRIAIPAETIRDYLTRNIHYSLSPECVESVRMFRAYAAELGVLPETTLRFL